MAGHDRHGAWYARHQVIEGLGFDKFKQALLREFPETMLEQGAPGIGAKRGLAAERRLERIDVPGVGRVEVYELSAQMPPPVTPREFLTLFMSTDDGLTEKSGAAAHDGTKHVPRNFMIVSRPLTHPDAPERSSFVRGKYESVELIREIPLHVSPSKTNQDGEIDPELNPVEWIMVTRSDPAGGVPRFLVDRGTPGAMLGDVTKFLDWACPQEEIPHQDAGLDNQSRPADQNGVEATDKSVPEPNTTPSAAPVQQSVQVTAPSQDREAIAAVDGATAGTESAPAQQPGMVSNLTSTLEAGVNTYAPTSVANFVNTQLHPQNGTPDTSDADSDSDSSDSFMSADEMKRFSTAHEAPDDGLPRDSTENLSVMSGASSSEISRSDKKHLSSHDKEVLKLTQQREKLDQKLAEKRKAQESKLKSSQEKEESESVKAKEKLEKEMQKAEERHKKEIEKLEARREKELKKAEARRKKRADGDKLSLVARERDDFRSQADLHKKENELLREQVEHLQRENTALASKLGKVGGPEALKSVQDEVGKRSRSGTRSGETASQKSSAS